MTGFFAYLLTALLFFSPTAFFPATEHAEVPTDITLSLPPPTLSDFSPVVTAKSALMVDVASGGKIWGKNEYAALPIASLTKLMTALIMVENHDLSEVVPVPRVAAEIEGTSAHLLAGETLTVHDLLYALLVPSGNDAALALAIFDAGSEESFVEKMNRRAKLLSMDSTHFVNVHGLDADGHVSSAHDLAILARQILKNPLLKEIVNVPKATINSTDGKFSHTFFTTNDLLASPFPIFGIKTGTTDAAGQCLITLLKTKTHEIVIVVLGSSDRFQDTKALLFPF